MRDRKFTSRKRFLQNLRYAEDNGIFFKWEMQNEYYILTVLVH